MEPTLGALLARIEGLEKANGRLRILVMLAFGIFAVFGFTAAASTTTGPMNIRGSNGHSVHIDGDYIAFEDSTGQSRLTIGISSAGNAQLTMHDASGTERSYLGRFTDGSYGLSLDDRSGSERAYIGLSSSDNPQVRLSDASKSDRIFIRTYSDGAYGQSIYDASHSVLWKAP